MRLRNLALGMGTAAALAATVATAAHASGTPQLVVTQTQTLPALNQNPHVVARDNGQSAEYDGRSVWIFDDTILQNPDGFLSNSGATTTDLDGSDGIDLLSDNPFTDSTGVPTELMPLTDAESAFQAAHAAPCATGDEYCGTQFAFWPGPVVADPARHRIIFSYGKLCRGGPDDGPCASGFVGQAIGTGFAELDMRTDQVKRIDVQHQDPSITSPEGTDPALMFPPDKTFGSGEMVLRGNMLYAYGACDSDNVCGVARVPVAQIQNRLAWRYYAGAHADGTPIWSQDMDDAVTVGANNGAAGGTVQWVPAIHGYLDTYMGGISNVGYYQTAPNPWGPWTAPRQMFTGLPTNTLWDYAMFAHPEYATNGGLTQYISYYRPEDGAQELVRVDFAVQSGD